MASAVSATADDAKASSSAYASAYAHVPMPAVPGSGSGSGSSGSSGSSGGGSSSSGGSGDGLCEVPMTPYVVTRWYRAPEVLLTDGCYDCAQVRPPTAAFAVILQLLVFTLTQPSTALHCTALHCCSLPALTSRHFCLQPHPPPPPHTHTHTPKQDVWAAGCTFAEFVARKPLFPGNCSVDQLRLIVRCMGAPRPTDLAFAGVCCCFCLCSCCCCCF